jgi:hypothetical protein
VLELLDARYTGNDCVESEGRKPSVLALVIISEDVMDDGAGCELDAPSILVIAKAAPRDRRCIRSELPLPRRDRAASPAALLKLFKNSQSFSTSTPSNEVAKLSLLVLGIARETMEDDEEEAAVVTKEVARS